MLVWPLKSPNLNVIENMWNELFCRVYTNGRQCMTTKDLKNTVGNEWKNIPQNYIKILFRSMKKRIFADYKRIALIFRSEMIS